jgi:hypothetical protein
MPAELTEEDLFAWLWVLWADAGHPDCAGYTLDPRYDELICSCGVPLFEVVPVAKVLA